jgi:hypothetical protein
MNSGNTIFILTKNAPDEPVILAFPATNVAGNRGADFVQRRDYMHMNKS